MKKVKFDKSDKPQPLLDIKFSDQTVDLQNEFLCIKINIEHDSMLIDLKKSDENNLISKTKFKKGYLKFKEFEIESLKKILLEKFPASLRKLSVGHLRFSLDNKNDKTLFVMRFADTTSSEDYEIIASELQVKFW
jgi:hypothetical protein